MARVKKSKSFEYNLEAVLKVRKIKEDREKEKFALAVRKLQEEQKRLDEMVEFKEEKRDELKEVISPGKTIKNFAEIIMRQSHLDKVKKDIIRQDEVKKEAETQKEEQRVVLEKSMKEKKIIEKDKGKKKDEWKKIIEHEETKFLDDIASSRFTRDKRISQGDAKN